MLIGQHFKDHGHIFATKMSHKCDQAAVLNAVQILRGTKVAEYALFILVQREVETRVLNLGAMNRLIDLNVTHIH